MRNVAEMVDFGQFLSASIDAKWGRCKESRKSASGWVIAINGTPIVFRTLKQSILAVNQLCRNTSYCSIALNL